MAHIETTAEIALVHRKDGVPVAVTLTNGHHTLYKLAGEMKRGEVEEFYEVNKTSHHGENKQSLRGSTNGPSSGGQEIGS